MWLRLTRDAFCMSFLWRRYVTCSLYSHIHADDLQLASYGFAYGTLATVIILGFVDDSFDIRWRHKFFIPAFASLPILGLYFVDFCVTQIVVPIPLRPYFGELLDLGRLKVWAQHANNY